jgi:hypothetical protein
MGIDHNDAKTLLEDGGFTVTEIEADASTILPETSYNRTIKKGQVFKVNDEVNPNYNEEGYSNPNKSDSDKVTIYYAIEDYIYEKPEDETGDTETPIESEADATEAEAADATTQESDKASDNSSYDWKQYLKDYEEWVDLYIAWVKKANKNPDDTELWGDYADMMAKATEFSGKASEIESELTGSDLMEFTEAYLKIMQKYSKAYSEME